MFIIDVRTKTDSEIAYVTTSIEKAVELIIQDGDGWYHNEDYCFYIWESNVDSIECFNDSSNQFYIDRQGNLSKDNPLYTNPKNQ